MLCRSIKLWQFVVFLTALAGAISFGVVSLAGG